MCIMWWTIRKQLYVTSMQYVVNAFLILNLTWNFEMILMILFLLLKNNYVE